MMDTIVSKFYSLLPGYAEVPKVCELSEDGYMKLIWDNGAEIRVYTDGLLGLGDETDRYKFESHIPFYLLKKIPKVG